MQEILHAKLSTSGASHSGRKFSMRQPNYPRLSPLPTTVLDTALTGYIRNCAITKVQRKASCHQSGSVDPQPH